LGTGRRANYDRQVFLNCPYDDPYLPLLKATAFTVHACGFQARLALEETGSEDVRLERLVRLVAACRLAIHDISRVQVPVGRLPRFNMPFEFGLFVGARRFGTGAQRKKRFLLLDTKPFQYRESISDVAGLDIQHHDDRTDLVIRATRGFLQGQTSARLPGVADLVSLYGQFAQDLPQLARDVKLAPDEIEHLGAINDWLAAVIAWLQRRVP
jgi:hypothetical protein